jgi:hypothetical protein
MPLPAARGSGGDALSLLCCSFSQRFDRELRSRVDGQRSRFKPRNGALRHTELCSQFGLGEAQFLSDGSYV